MTLAAQFFLACDRPALSFFWKQYVHPSFGFSFKYPRSWTIEEGSLFGTQLTLLAKEKDALFRTNLNFVVEKRPAEDLETAVAKAKTQLRMLLNEYQVLAEAKREIDGHLTWEIRGRYEAVSDPRIIRTFMFFTADYLYVITFTAREKYESQYHPTLSTLLDSFTVNDVLGGK